MIDPSQLEGVFPRGNYVARVTQQQQHFTGLDEEEDVVEVDCELLRLDVVFDEPCGPELVCVETLWEPTKQLREIALDTLQRALLREAERRGWPPCTVAPRLWLPTQCYLTIRPKDFT